MDTLGNLLTSIRNAELANHSELTVPFARTSTAVLEILKKNGYVTSYTEEAETARKMISITLPTPITRHHYKRISKPGRRLYTEVKDIPTVLRGLGLVIISTPKGMLTGKDARKQKVGGELICEVY
jgi:small subunit ribosomal protein S8